MGPAWGISVMGSWKSILGQRDPKPIVTLPAPVPPPPSPPTEPEWFKIAKGELGIKEIPGSADNQRIMDYFSYTTYDADHDEDAWCSAFAVFCIERSGWVSTKSTWARSFLDWGTHLANPKKGCIVVLERGSNAGHIGFMDSEVTIDGRRYLRLLGGNQSDSVCYSNFPIERVLGYRWPSIKR